MSDDRSTDTRFDDTDVSEIDDKYSAVDPEDVSENAIDYFADDPSTEDDKGD